jgi:hypothetical protein
VTEVLALRRALVLLALRLPAYEASLSHAALRWHPRRAMELRALSAAVFLLRSEHNRIAGELERMERLGSSD